VTPGDWVKVETAFHRALSLEADRRESFVAGFAAREPELVSLLRALLAADAEGDLRLFGEIAAIARSFLRGRRRP